MTRCRTRAVRFSKIDGDAHAAPLRLEPCFVCPSRGAPAASAPLPGAPPPLLVVSAHLYGAATPLIAVISVCFDSAGTPLPVGAAAAPPARCVPALSWVLAVGAALTPGALATSHVPFASARCVDSSARSRRSSTVNAGESYRLFYGGEIARRESTRQASSRGGHSSTG